MSLKDRVAIITGANQGIGRAIAETLGSDGASVVCVDINISKTFEIIEEIEKKGGNGMTLPCDVSSSEQVAGVVEKVLDKFSRVDILINNAGVTKDNLLMRMSEADWDTVLSINLKGVFLFSKAVIRPMLKARWGRIINIASVVGIIGNAGQTNYSASKAGVIGFTKSLAKEIASRSITVNAVAPGFIATAMTDVLPEDAKKAMLSQIPLARTGTPQEVAEAVKFLASESASYITGQVINVSGGMAM